jgi:integrase/recombinase XerD
MMKKLQMCAGKSLSSEEGCNKYLENCRQRNLREGTINHYRQSYVQFFKFFDPNMPIEEMDQEEYKKYVNQKFEMVENNKMTDFS